MPPARLTSPDARSASTAIAAVSTARRRPI
jgi:hypothetical protein